MLLKGEWSEEELKTLKEAFEPQDDWKEAVREVSVYFPERGVRDITQQLREMGLLARRQTSTLSRLSIYMFLKCLACCSCVHLFDV